MPGGFLGVDVFFVISGYLIASLLLSEYRRSGGTVKLGQFWLRRARRLLPAVGVLIAVTMVVAAIAEPEWMTELRGDAISSLGYVANWHFVFEHQSYFDQWAPMAASHEDLLWDGIHLTPGGAGLYTRLVVKDVRAVLGADAPASAGAPRRAHGR